MIKKISLAIVFVLAIPFAIALFLPTHYEVEREVTVDKPLDTVFAYVKLLKNQDSFSKWMQMDPDMKKTYTGVDGEVGFVSAWDSKNDDVGVGEQEIVGIVDGQRIDYELRFLKPFEATSPAYMTTHAVSPNQTTVKWGFQGSLDYPMNIMFLFMDFEQVIGDDLQFGLNNMKENLEAK
ncbi:SRPBCC family protein [Thalassotalea euphylliae]|uniref:SRPBCC family protein n=1 Tax=Thalassotalea euphylliae TaxID=1655234 RepID=UPI003625F880